MQKATSLDMSSGDRMPNQVSFRAHIPLLLYLMTIFLLNFLARVILSPLMLMDEAGYYFTVSGYGANGGILIIAHEAAVTFDIRTENSG